MDVHTPKNCICRYWSIAMFIYILHFETISRLPQVWLWKTHILWMYQNSYRYILLIIIIITIIIILICIYIYISRYLKISKHISGRKKNPRYPLVSFETNPLATSVLEQKVERRLRTAWTLVPNVGFVLAAMVPSLSVPVRKIQVQSCGKWAKSWKNTGKMWF